MTDQESGAQGERPLSDEERAELYREQLKKLHVIDLVRDMMVTLVTVGYEKLGLTDQTRDLRDLGDARVAIESLRRLIEVVEGEGDPEAGALRSTLAQMQLNFARASAESRTTPRPADAASAPVAEPSEAESRPGVETEGEAQKAPSAQETSPKPAAEQAPTPEAEQAPTPEAEQAPQPEAKKAAPRPSAKKAAPRSSATRPASKPAAKKAASAPKKTPRKKPSGGAQPGA